MAALLERELAPNGLEHVRSENYAVGYALQCVVVEHDLLTLPQLVNEVIGESAVQSRHSMWSTAPRSETVANTSQAGDVRRFFCFFSGLCTVAAVPPSVW